MLKQFSHDFEEGYFIVWRDDIDAPETEEYLVLEPVVDYHQKPMSNACNPYDYYGYTDGHLEVYDKTNGWNDRDTEEAVSYVEGFVNYEEFLDDDRY